jgi:hypothetical protein
VLQRLNPWQQNKTRQSGHCIKPNVCGSRIFFSLRVSDEKKHSLPLFLIKFSSRRLFYRRRKGRSRHYFVHRKTGNIRDEISRPSLNITKLDHGTKSTSEGERLYIGRITSSWKDNVKTNVTEMWLGCAEWSHLPEDRNRFRLLLRNTIMKLVAPQTADKFDYPSALLAS